MEVITAIMKFKNILTVDVERAREIKNEKKGKFDNRIYLLDVEQDFVDEREEKEMQKEWRKN